jgi:aldose 1-epimerase
VTKSINTDFMQVIHLNDGQDLNVEVLPFGAIIKSIRFRQKEMTLTVKDADYYLDNPFYFGATVGRVANRIAKGQFSLAGKTYQLEKNDGSNNLHSGQVGFNKVPWQVIEQTPNYVVLFYQAEDGEQGFPGRLNVYQYISVEGGQLIIRFKATTDAETVINLTNHCYFNLEESDSVLNHLLQVNSEYYLAIDENAIPIKKMASVSNSCFDFTRPTRIGDALTHEHPQLALVNGFDHCYVFEDDNACKPLAKLHSIKNDITLTVHSTQPGLQVYTGNYVSAPFKARQAVCLEAQNWPDAVNRADFPRANLCPDEEYKQTIVYAFS